MELFPPAASRAQELQARISVEREGRAFLAVLDADERERLAVLDPQAAAEITLGRDERCDVRLDWDPEVSRVHAVLQRLAGGWVLADDGLSRNGTYVNAERVVGRRPLRDGDRIQAGNTSIGFFDPRDAAPSLTIRAGDTPAAVEVTPAQRRVLVALCRPLADPETTGLPSGNQAIAEELFLSVESVKNHLRAMFAAFELDDLPQNAKRVRLADLALRSGVLSRRDLS